VIVVLNIGCSRVNSVCAIQDSGIQKFRDSMLENGIIYEDRYNTKFLYHDFFSIPRANKPFTASLTDP